jgi:hypothetical protein
VPRMRQVMYQTKARVFAGDTHVEGKIVSLFEPTTLPGRQNGRARNRKFADSLLEEDGFKPSVPLTGYAGLFRERVRRQKGRTGSNHQASPHDRVPDRSLDVRLHFLMGGEARDRTTCPRCPLQEMNLKKSTSQTCRQLAIID